MQPSDRFRDAMCYAPGPVTSTVMGPHISGMQDVRFALSDREHFSHSTESWLPAGVPHSMALDGLWGTDGKRHALRRQLLSRLLSLQAAQAMTPVLDMLIMSEIRAAASQGDTFNFAALAYGATFRSVLLMIGMPPDASWLLGHLRTYERQASIGDIRPEAPEVRSYFVSQLKQRQAEQRARKANIEDPHDLLEVLADALTRKVVSLDDACGDIMMFLAAGMGTTGTVASNTFGLVHETPNYATALREHLDEPAYVDSFNLESLRFKTAFSHGPTNVLSPVRLPSGAELQPGIATLCFSAANRDAPFDDPHEYKPHRDHLDASVGFGHGRHLCPGRHHGLVAARRILTLTHKYMVGLTLDPSGVWENRAAITDVVESAPAWHDSHATLSTLPLY